MVIHSLNNQHNHRSNRSISNVFFISNYPYILKNIHLFIILIICMSIISVFISVIETQPWVCTLAVHATVHTCHVCVCSYVLISP